MGFGEVVIEDGEFGEVVENGCDVVSRSWASWEDEEQEADHC